MLSFFRHIRQKLIGEKRLRNYLLYAFGEIVLVVIGILIALQINNWNLNRQKQALFHNSLEQLYNSIKIDTESLIFGIEYTKNQVALIDSLLKDPQIFTPEQLPMILYYLDQDFNIEQHNLETGYLISTLQYNPQDPRQREIAKELTSYSSFHTQGHNNLERELTTLLESHNIPNPNPSFGFSSYDNFNEVDTSFYNENDLETTARLMATEKVRALLLSLKAEKSFRVDVEYSTFLNDGVSILNLIKDYNPDVRLLYKNVGILGSAFRTGWDKSVPMKLTDAEKQVWELDVFLNEGDVKFRTRDSWLVNWGGKDFPKGKTIYFGDNINVEKGYYHVQINLLENTYEFTRKDEKAAQGIKVREGVVNKFK